MPIGVERIGLFLPTSYIFHHKRLASVAYHSCNCGWIHLLSSVSRWEIFKWKVGRFAYGKILFNRRYPRRDPFNTQYRTMGISFHRNGRDGRVVQEESLVSVATIGHI